MLDTKKTSLILLALLLIVSTSHGAPFDSEPVTSVQARVSPAEVRPGGSFRLIVQASIRPGYHVGSADKDALFPAELRIQAPEGVTFDEPVFPKDERKSFEFTSDTIPVYEDGFEITVRGHAAADTQPGDAEILVSLTTQACKDDQCYPPEDVSSTVNLTVSRDAPLSSVESDASSVSDDEAAARSLAGSHVAQRVVMLYLGGLLLALTPCVYPMIPVTVGYFGAQSGQRRSKVVSLAAAYVLGLATTYAALGAIAATTGGALGSALQSPAVLVGIAGLLVLLALSMFGLYELRPPRFIQDRSSGRSGIGGALLMGLVFGIVAAPCAGPFVLGLTLFAAKTGSPLIGFAMFFILAMGMGTPLFLLATFSAKLPVPGRWMVVAERIGGFALLGAAVYFVAPLVPEPVRRFLIPAVILAAGLYIGCVQRAFRSTRILAVISKGFCLAAVGAAVFMVWPTAAGPSMQWTPFDSGGFAEAIESGRPVIVDFAADWCAACKELDEGPWKDPRVIEATEGFARFRVDGTKRTPEVTAAEKQLGVEGKGYPIVLLFDGSGREVRNARIIGYVTSEEMLRRIRLAK